MINVKTLVLLLMVPLFLYAQDKDYSGELGYVDFGDFSSIISDDNITEVYLDEGILGMVSKMSKDDQGEFMSKLKLIRVNVFQVEPGNQKNVMSKINDIDKKLSAQKWNRIVRTKSKTEVANVYIKQDANNRIAGLVVTTIDEKGEAAFINIVGQIDLENMGMLGDKFNIPSLGNGSSKGDGDSKKK
jgi:hypothetical protein